MTIDRQGCRNRDSNEVKDSQYRPGISKGLVDFSLPGNEPEGTETEAQSTKTPKTPRKHVANSGLKRLPRNLTRSTPGSSHHDKMADVFESAGKALHKSQPPRLLTPTNARRLRPPLSRNKIRGYDLVGSNMLESPSHPNTDQKNLTAGPASTSVADADIEFPIGDSIVTERDSARLKHPINKVTYPVLPPKLPSPVNIRLSHNTPSSSEKLSSQNYETVSTDNRLMNTQNALSLRSRQCFGRPAKSAMNTSSPSMLPKPSTSSSPTRIQTPLTRKKITPTSRFAHPLLKPGHYSEPPKRRKNCTSPPKTSGLVSPKSPFVVFEDSIDVPELSPSVERYRKGQGPRRERCMSYWDQDVLPEAVTYFSDSEQENDGRRDLQTRTSRGNEGRTVFCELKSLTKPKPFIQGAESAKFSFGLHKDQGAKGAHPKA